jgi:hypothetical protein
MDFKTYEEQKQENLRNYPNNPQVTVPLAYLLTAAEHLDSLEDVFDKVLCKDGFCKTLDFQIVRGSHIAGLRRLIEDCKRKAIESQPKPETKTEV